ncbi:MAG: hypothetical protein KAW17_12735 [Candidatus Eisenbacteria sp.]|nr:hypothetical protein [Candidatus Eisenbacteria bacterium]
MPEEKIDLSDDSRILERSPARIFERAIQGGLGRGNVGVVLSRPGVGKTAFLIGLALDALLNGRKVLHISTQESVDRVRGFYEHMFHMLAASLHLDRPQERLLAVERNRHILAYNREFFSLEKLESSVAVLKEATNFVPSFVITDGTPRFGKTEQWEMDGICRLAKEWDAEIWTSSLTHREGQDLDSRGVPVEVACFDSSLAVIINLVPTADYTRVAIVKDHDRASSPDLHLELDPTTLLLRW